MTEVVVNLDEEQRFAIEDPDSVSMILVDQITIHPVACQIIYSGYSFNVDYEKMDFTNRKKVNMVLDTTLNVIYGEDD